MSPCAVAGLTQGWFSRELIIVENSLPQSTRKTAATVLNFKISL